MAEQNDCQQPEAPILCANNCGFFGSKATMNLCSKCYRDVVLSQANVNNALEQLRNKKQEQQQPSADPASEATDAVTSSSVAAAVVGNSSSSDPASTAAGTAEGGGSRPPSNRCFACNKRVGLTGFNCRCGNVFCAHHRYSDKHNCSFDYRTAGRDAIAKANPIVKADKIDKI